MRAKPLRAVTQEESEAFHRDGAIVLKGVLPEEWVDVAREGLEQAIEAPDGMSGGMGDLLRIDQFPASRIPALKRIIDESPVAEIVGSALRAPVRFYMDQLFSKPAGYIAPTPWHQDTSYYNLGGHGLNERLSIGRAVSRSLDGPSNCSRTLCRSTS